VSSFSISVFKNKETELAFSSLEFLLSELIIAVLTVAGFPQAV